MADTSLFYTLHPITRVLLALALLMLASTTTSTAYGLIVLLIACLSVRAIDKQWDRVGRSFGLLRWFIIPILLLHLCFSPGQLMLPGWALPFTWEGLQLGLQLSVHLAALFFAAIVMFLALRRSEWIQLLLLLPFFSSSAITYLVMMTPLRSSVGELLQAFRSRWQLRRSWQQLPVMLVSTFSTALALAEVQSQQLWLRWPSSADSQFHATSQAAASSLIVNLLCLSVAVSGLGVAWQM